MSDQFDMPPSDQPIDTQAPPPVPKPIRRNVCQKCSTYEKIGESGSGWNRKVYGLCRRNPPRVDTDGVAVWPYVAETDWCGEFN